MKLVGHNSIKREVYERHCLVRRLGSAGQCLRQHALRVSSLYFRRPDETGLKRCGLDCPAMTVLRFKQGHRCSNRVVICPDELADEEAARWSASHEP